MRSVRLLALAAGILILAGACGDDDDAATTAAPTTTVASTTTAAPETTTTTAAPETTTTSEATTTSAATTTTLPADVHPVFGVSWSEFLPEDGATALYHMNDYGFDLDLEARFEAGVEFRGGSFDRLSLGTPEPGNDAVTFYVDSGEPWVVEFVGSEIFSTENLGGPMVLEVPVEPMIFDLMVPEGETQTHEGTFTTTFGGDETTTTITVELTLRTSSAEVTVPAGTFAPVAVYDITVGGGFFGGDFTWPVEMTVDPEDFVLRSVGGEDGETLTELIEPWG